MRPIGPSLDEPPPSRCFGSLPSFAFCRSAHQDNTKSPRAVAHAVHRAIAAAVCSRGRRAHGREPVVARRALWATSPPITRRTT